MRIFAVWIFFIVTIGNLLAIETTKESNTTQQTSGYPITLYGREVLRIHESIGAFSAEQRSEQVSQTLLNISKKNTFDVSNLIQTCNANECLIRYNKEPIMAITLLDANLSGKELNAYALEVRKIVAVALEKEHKLHQTQYIFREVGTVFGMLIGLVLFLFVLDKLFTFFYRKLRESRLFKTLIVRNFEVIQGETLRSLAIITVKLTRLSLSLFSIYYFMVTSFALLPWTQELELEPVLKKIMLVIFSTLVTFFLIRSSSMLHMSLLRKLFEFKKGFFKPLEIGGFTVLSVQKEMELLTLFARVFMLAFVLFVTYSYITFVFSLFDFTKTWAQILISYFLTPIQVVFSAMISFIPNIFYIVVIVYAFRYLLKMIHYIFMEIDTQNVKIEGFHPELALPTYGVIRVLIMIFAAIVIFPYLPGSNSPFFQGISIFMGLLLSMGSSSAIANIVAGIVLIYMRPFKIGDRVKIADTIGDVVEKNFLVTRIRTIKNVDITIPNASVLGGHIVNYSSSASQAGLILNTTVTIGYDVPWRDVHALLINSAKVTEDILDQPAPFVLQTSLDDFYVSYELNAYTDKPGKMARTYSDLHAAIQDHFNKAGVEIMSPHYGTLRDGNETTIPADYRPDGYIPPPFGIRLQDR